jgi:hypothetical protein
MPRMQSWPPRKSQSKLRTGQRRVVYTDRGGHYSVPDLPIGVYTVKIGKNGFATVKQSDLELSVAQSAVLNFVLTPGVVTELVTVNGELSPGDAQPGTTFTNRQIADLPINRRDYARFSLLAPGAVARSNLVADLSFSGQSATQNQFAIDGVDATRVDVPFMANGAERGARLTGSLDTIDEFRIQTSGLFYKPFHLRALAVVGGDDHRNFLTLLGHGLND